MGSFQTNRYNPGIQAKRHNRRTHRLLTSYIYFEYKITLGSPPYGGNPKVRRSCLLTAIAAAHALVTGLSAAAVAAGLYLNGVQRAVLLITTMKGAAGYTAANVGIGLFLRHNEFLLRNILLTSAQLSFPESIDGILFYRISIKNQTGLHRKPLTKPSKRGIILHVPSTFSSVGRAPDS